MRDLDERLSPSFTLRELLASDVAERTPALRARQYDPPGDVVAELRYLATTVLQPVRDLLGHPIRISSGYRCPEVNRLVGGSPTSQHVVGEAADCSLAPSFVSDPGAAPQRTRLAQAFEQRTGRPLRPDLDANGMLFVAIVLSLESLDVDQVIHEYGEDYGRPAWVHVSASRRRDQREIVFVGVYTANAYIKMKDAKAALLRGAA